MRLRSSRGRGNHGVSRGRDDGSNPPPQLGVNPCLSSSYDNCDGFRPRPVQIERYSTPLSGLTSSARLAAFGRSEHTGRSPSPAGDQALILEECSQRIERYGFLECKAHSLSGWCGAARVQCWPVSAGASTVTRVEATSSRCGPTGGCRASAPGAESECSSVSRRQRRSVPRIRRSADGNGKDSGGPIQSCVSPALILDRGSQTSGCLTLQDWLGVRAIWAVTIDRECGLGPGCTFRTSTRLRPERCESIAGGMQDARHEHIGARPKLRRPSISDLARNEPTGSECVARWSALSDCRLWHATNLRAIRFGRCRPARSTAHSCLPSVM